MSKRKAVQQTLESAFARSPSPDKKRPRAAAATATAAAVGTGGAVLDAADIPKPESLEALMSSLGDGLPGSFEEQHRVLQGIAGALMTHFELVVAGGATYRLAEVEAYLHHAATHDDVYTHKQDEQLESACWYFHKQGKTGSYKGGTYKGLDLTGGHRGNKVHCGFLIRSLQPLGRGVGAKPIEGPCMCVNRILEANGVDSIADLVGEQSGDELSASTFKGLQLRLCDAAGERAVHAAPRVGLTLREGAARLKFCARPYRFSIVPNAIGKFRSGFAAAAAVAGVSQVSIMERLGMKNKYAMEYCAAALQGAKEKEYSKYFDKTLNNSELCGMYGACRGFF